MNFEKELDIAIEAVAKACNFSIKIQQNLISNDSVNKSDKTPVTVADFGSQAIINKYLINSFSYPIMAEEDSKFIRSKDGSVLKNKIITELTEFMNGESAENILDYIDQGNFSGGNSEIFWALDPIDGTKGFLRKQQYAIALSLIDRGEVVLGILGCPNLYFNMDNNSAKGCILFAHKGVGAFQRKLESKELTKINVSDISNCYNATFCESVESSHSSHNTSAKIAELLGVKNEPIRIDSQCKYAVLGRGDASIYLRLPTKKNYKEKIWDHAAGYIIVKEAGGKVTDCNGNRLNFSVGRELSHNTGIIGTNGLIHNEVVNAVVSNVNY